MLCLNLAAPERVQHLLGKERLVPRANRTPLARGSKSQFTPWRTVSCAYQYASSTQPP